MIGSSRFKELYRQQEHDFSRTRLLSFAGLVVSQINRMSKSLSVEISKFMGRFFGEETDYTKQAYSLSRLKLKAEAFISLNRKLVEDYYREGNYKHWQGFTLLACDGSLLQLPQSQELTAHFGLAENKGRTMPMSRSSLFYDIENEIVVDALPGRYSDDEQHMALAHLDYLQQLRLPGPCLLLFDRGYPSLWLLACLKQRKLGFLMRIPPTFISEIRGFVESKSTDSWLSIDLLTPQRKKDEALQKFVDPDEPILQLRAVKIKLDNNQTELLLTNLEKVPLASLKKLYHKRWGVETGIDFLKNVVEIENFSAKTVLGVCQDFHAAILASNLRMLLVEAAEQELATEQAGKSNKHIYRINRAVALGLVKDQLAALLLSTEPAEIIYQRLIKKIKRRKEAVKPQRKYPRKNPLSYKFHVNKRKVI